MSSTIYSGISQLPGDFDNSRVAPEIRRALSGQSPEIARHVKSVADAPPSPGRQDSRPDWKQPTSNSRKGA